MTFLTDFWGGLPNGLQASLFITLVMMVVLVIYGVKVKKLQTSEVPTGFTFILVKLVEMVNDNQRDFFKKHWRTFTPLLFTLLLYLSLANTASLFGLTAPLSNFAVAIGFSVFAFLAIQVSALIIKKPKQRMKDLMDPHWAFTPINLIGEFSTPFAMGLRLFGNLISGSVIAVFIYYILQWGGLLVGPFLHAVFDIFFGVVQAYVYYMLMSIFLSGAVED
ncbi:F0F1 ATP synthase subunit A [Candidatus Izimaplasma bacterium HR1]|uniref:F0F1 ATP synthase subunit A n=1 Tax=Candidatus Izimoplasma sp. HR1 TaxID=1541959 RepID=UPI00056FF659